MTDDAKILSAILALHERFVEEPTEQKARHIDDFIEGSYLDVTPPALEKLTRYWNAIERSEANNFSPKSIAHLNEVAKECLG